uniref:DHN1 n=1 Tax=Medicago sativa TaxID=3879 RepID=A0A7G5VWW1_MEDSA|nr:DHN1 [Medicago sativa]UUZ30945.1 salt tolerant protein [Medicago sativa]
MAEENQNKYEETTATNSETEIKDRGVFDFLGGKKKDEEHIKPQEDAVATDFSHKVTLYEAPSETKVEEKEEGEKKHTSLLEKLHRSDSSSSSSSEEEVDGERRKKKKKEKKEKKEDTSVPVEKVDVVDGTTASTEEKKGFLDKIKEKLPGHKKTDDVTTPPPVVVAPAVPSAETTTTTASHDQGEKKGILEKIKEKIPGYHPKTATEHEDNKDHHKDETTSH